jgi:hypothetical protein
VRIVTEAGQPGRDEQVADARLDPSTERAVPKG